MPLQQGAPLPLLQLGTPSMLSPWGASLPQLPWGLPSLLLQQVRNCHYSHGKCCCCHCNKDPPQCHHNKDSPCHHCNKCSLATVAMASAVNAVATGSALTTIAMGCLLATAPMGNNLPPLQWVASTQCHYQTRKHASNDTIHDH